MSPFDLGFLESSYKEWNLLDNSIRQEFEKKLITRLQNPRNVGSALTGNLRNCFKIKSHRYGYRLTYLVEEDSNMVIVLAIGKRERSDVYDKTLLRLSNLLKTENKETPPLK